MNPVVRGEIWRVQLDPTLGSEINKTRPCVVISPPEMHDLLRTVIVAPMTTGSRPAPYRIGVTHAGKRGLILLDQIRATDKQRLIQRLGALRAATLNAVLATLQEQFAE
ncbi:MAG: type II toxin-antitoxin system PemK/MazF family toxin [Lysobacterales bacterium]